MQRKFKHQKRRNVGLLYEFFVRYLGKAILEGRDSDINKAKALLKKHFNRGTDIYRELRLFRVLSEGIPSTREQAIHLINRVREAVKLQSQARLDLEKTSLIHEINANLNGATLFFEEDIPDYKKLATVQVLLNIWRDEILKEDALGETAELEERLTDYMLEKKERQTSADVTSALAMTTEDVDRLVVNILTEKVNKKYEGLTSEQKNIINLYVFSKDDPSAKTRLAEQLTALRIRFHHALLNHSDEFQTDPILMNKLQEVQNKLRAEYGDVSTVTEDLVSFYLGLSKLAEEVQAK